MPKPDLVALKKEYNCVSDFVLAIRLADEVERLREALILPLIFHAGGHVTAEMRERWKKITGCDEMTNAVMCAAIRVLLVVDKISDAAPEGTDDDA